MHFLNFISLLVYVSPPCASLPCHASFTAVSEFGWARFVLAVRHRPHEDVMGLEWCMGMPPLCTSYTLFLFSFTSPHHALLSLVMLPSPQRVSSVGQGLCWLCMHRPHEDVVGLEWCMGMTSLLHFLNFICLLGYVSPPCASLPCHASLHRW